MICYDVTCDRARLRVAKALGRYGERVQGSVFECFLTDREFGALRRELSATIDLQADRVRFYPLCVRDRAAARVDGAQAPPVSTDVAFRLL